jgi:hypothetical protein
MKWPNDIYMKTKIDLEAHSHFPRVHIVGCYGEQEDHCLIFENSTLLCTCLLPAGLVWHSNILLERFQFILLNKQLRSIPTSLTLSHQSLDINP